MIEEINYTERIVFEIGNPELDFERKRKAIKGMWLDIINNEIPVYTSSSVSSTIYPRKENIEEEGVYEGIITEVVDDKIKVSIFEGKREIEAFFPRDLFQREKPVPGKDVKYHVWKLRTGEYGGYFEVIGGEKPRLSLKDIILSRKIFNKWKEELRK